MSRWVRKSRGGSFHETQRHVSKEINKNLKIGQVGTSPIIRRQKITDTFRKNRPESTRVDSIASHPIPENICPASRRLRARLFFAQARTNEGKRWFRIKRKIPLTGTKMSIFRKSGKRKLRARCVRWTTLVCWSKMIQRFWNDTISRLKHSVKSKEYNYKFNVQWEALQFA